MPTELLPLGKIIAPKNEKPHLVANVDDAIAHPERTLRDYLLTPGLRGHFNRVFQDVKEERGGGYWVQAEYGGGKTHFLASLLCLLSQAPDDVEEQIWEAVGDDEFRQTWETIIRPRRILGAHMSLMGTTAVLGSRQEPLLDLIDEAVVDALKSHGVEDPGIRASGEVFRAYESLDSAIRGAVDRAFQTSQDVSIAEHRSQFGDDNLTANVLVQAAESVNVNILQNRQVQDHARHIHDRLKDCGFDGLLVVIDEYLSRESALDDAQKNDDGAVLETLGFMLGRQVGLPIYVVVASQGPLPAKLKERFEPLTLLSQDDEYSQIVCNRVMDFLEPVEDQALLYHSHFSKRFSFLRRMEAQDTRAIFPFQPAVFRFLRDLVSAPRVNNVPSARFAIGVSYDAISQSSVLEQQRFVTTADLMGGSLAQQLAAPVELRDAASALRQAREFIDNFDWQLDDMAAFAHRIVNHLYLDSLVRENGQSIDQIVEGTLVEDPNGRIAPAAMVKAVMQSLRGCEQVSVKGDVWSFAARVSDGEQFESVLQRERRAVKADDPRIQGRWEDLLTATIVQAGGQAPFLLQVVQGLGIEVEHCGLVYPGRAVWVARNLQTHTEEVLKRLTQADRFKVVFVPAPLAESPRIDDPAVAVVSPGTLINAAIEELRTLVACEQIREEYRTRTEVGADRIASEAERRSRELVRTVVARQKATYAEGEIHTRDGLPLPAKQYFRDQSVRNGVELIASQLVRHVYPGASDIVKGRATRGAMKPADAQKVFDAVFGDAQTAQAKGAGEAFAPLLGLTAANNPTKLTFVPGGGVDAVAQFIGESGEGVNMADVYERFCLEPNGLPKGAVDLLAFGCLALGRPFPLEVHAGGNGYEPRPELRPRASIRKLRAAQLPQIAWPKDGLIGATFARSLETAWNDFAPIAQAFDSQRFIMTTEQREIEEQQRLFIDRLAVLHEHWDEIRRALAALRESAGTNPSAEALDLLKRVDALSALREGFDRDAVMKLVDETWGTGPEGIRALTEDIRQIDALTRFAKDSARLTGTLSWFREIADMNPDTLTEDIELVAPLISLEALTANPHQVHSAIKATEELHAKFMTIFRQEHSQHTAWVAKQRAALERAQHRIPTLQRLNEIAQLGPPEMMGAANEIARLLTHLRSCETPDAPVVGNGIACHSCRFRMGDVTPHAMGDDAEEAVSAAIQRRGHALTAGIIAETLAAAGDDDLTAVLAAAQAGSFDDVIEKDLLTDELVKRINSLLKRSKQQTVSGSSVHRFIERRPALTLANLDEWLSELRAELLKDLDAAKKGNPGKEITLLLREREDA